MSDVFTTLQATLGSYYVNNFNLFGRVWQVNIEGEPADRTGHLLAVADLYPQQIRHRRAAAPRSPTPASSSGRRSSPATTTTARSRFRAARRRASRPAPRSRRWPQVSAKTLPAGYSYEWTGHGLSGAGGRGADRRDPRSRDPVRVSVSGRSLRKLDDPGAGLAVGAGRGARRLYRHPAVPRVARPLRRDRARRADRDGRQKRHPDRRLCQGSARGRQGHSRSRRCSARECGFAR